MSFVSCSINLLRSRHEKCCTPQGVCLKEGQEAHRLGGHMSKGYESLKGIMQKTLHHSKPNPMYIARVKDSTASSLNDDMEELEKMVVDRIGRLKAAVKEGEAVVAGESEQAERVIESLRANIAVLEAKVKETEDTVRRKDSASQSMEKNLTAKIASLETHLSETEKIVPFVNEYRTFCSIPTPEVKVTFRHLMEIGFSC